MANLDGEDVARAEARAQQIVDRAEAALRELLAQSKADIREAGRLRGEMRGLPLDFMSVRAILCADVEVSKHPAAIVRDPPRLRNALVSIDQHGYSIKRVGDDGGGSSSVALVDGRGDLVGTNIECGRYRAIFVLVPIEGGAR